MTAAASGVVAHRSRNLAGYFDLRRDPSEMIGLFGELCRRPGLDETILTEMKPFCAFGASRAKPPMVISFTTNDGASPATEFGDKTMRALSFILAFGLVIAGPSFAGAPDGNLPGVGTFQYSGSPITPTASQSIVVAARF
ncbi:hypothetical protein CIT37_41975 [Bradyrhizobium ottawaense]|nr:hypothetical protein [Bradyrhizobium ottawaense]